MPGLPDPVWESLAASVASAVSAASTASTAPIARESSGPAG
ncbi:hypothetical protein [Kitasatospora sp. NPDC017646]